MAAAALSSDDDDDDDVSALHAAPASIAAPASDAPARAPASASNEMRPAATLLTLPGVISAAEMNTLSDSLGVSAARTLSVSDTLKLHGVLEAPADSTQLMCALRRLAMAPLTRGLSASTRIDEAVAAVQADESARADARELSARIVNKCLAYAVGGGASTARAFAPSGTQSTLGTGTRDMSSMPRCT